MSGIDIHQLAAAYALDAVDERERAEFEAHYPTCAICRPELAGFRETLSQVAASVAVDPPASLKSSVMTEIGTTRQLSPLLRDPVVDLATHRMNRQRMVRSLFAAAALIALVIGAFAMGRQSGGNNFADQAAAVFAKPDTLNTTLSGTGTGSFKVAWSPSSSTAVVVGDGLPDPGRGKAYELWLVDGSGPHAVRLLDRAADREVRRVVKVDGQPTQWAITVEPDSGVDKPTGDIIFSGAV
ncbi:MAG: anti-sigma factor [Ilumatobacteraceae bacterium]|nr:anti-sigma factor [Ilumatobacteraceae bacterium]